MDRNIVFPEVIDIGMDSGSSGVTEVRDLLPIAHANIAYDMSLILPMYNVAPFIKQCLDSVFGQQDVSLQIILINDGSTDESLAVALDYCRKRERPDVIIIDQENRGLSATRNLGVSLALAEYIAYLDTDDFMAPNAYSTLYRFAVAGELDVVLCRSLVFDQKSLCFSEFYDAEIWDGILREKHQRLTNAWRDPDMLMLEPNANPRIVRRSLIVSRGLLYPEGLHFEDLQVHLRTLLCTEKIGLLGARHYMYRINRPGKITDQKSGIRFDILQIFDQTVQLAKEFEIPPAQGACILYALLRITYWCGTQTSLSDRPRFFSELGQRFTAVPEEWITRFKGRYRNNMGRLVILWALRRQDTRLLVAISTGVRPFLKIAYYLVNQRRYGAILYQGVLAGKRLARRRPWRFAG